MFPSSLFHWPIHRRSPRYMKPLAHRKAAHPSYASPGTGEVGMHGTITKLQLALKALSGLTPAKVECSKHPKPLGEHR